jgi:hypothetical protein
VWQAEHQEVRPIPRSRVPPNSEVPFALPQCLQVFMRATAGLCVLAFLSRKSAEVVPGVNAFKATPAPSVATKLRGRRLLHDPQSTRRFEGS